MDLKALKGEPLLDTESPAAYVERQLRKWKQETREEIEKFPVLKTLFRDSILEVMPDPVRARLEDVVGVRLIPHDHFRQHVVHAVERY